ncbi:hypothetical protein [Roseobacter sp.]|uniref:hypothetical protein n=1 Tax=Roseobacter sp. TaxID=1907202 RepID=UPI002965EC8D|nr:hypothetical protein [Roseobacter sp.]MDW3181742.1 hypothetical protein [Roseobacter sp.]
MTKPAQPIKKKIPGLRQRYRQREGSWRVWWEPNAPQRAAGFQSVELDGQKPTWSIREAEKLNLQAGKTPTPTIRKGPEPKNSIDALRTAYLKSPKYLTKSEKTRAEYRKDLNRIIERWQGTDVRRMTKPVIFTWYEALYAKHGVYVSRRLIRMLSILMTYAEQRGMIPLNPCLRMGMITPKGRKRTATWTEYAALERAAEDLGHPKMRLAMGLSMFMGARATDVFTARAAEFVMHEVDGAPRALHWKLVRSKDTTLERLSYLVVHPEVLDMLQEALAAATSPRSHIITRDPDGTIYNDTSFPTVFAKIREEAARHCPSVYDIHFRDLRRTFSNNARHAGVVSDDVDDALGNTSGTDANLRQVYMPASDARAAEAIMAVARPGTAAASPKKRA